MCDKSGANLLQSHYMDLESKDLALIDDDGFKWSQHQVKGRLGLPLKAQPDSECPFPWGPDGVLAFSSRSANSTFR